MKLEDLKSNQSVKGLVPDAVVEVVQVDFFGADSCEVVFRKPGGGWIAKSCTGPMSQG